MGNSSISLSIKGNLIHGKIRYDLPAISSFTKWGKEIAQVTIRDTPIFLIFQLIYKYMYTYQICILKYIVYISILYVQIGQGEASIVLFRIIRPRSYSLSL